MAALQDIASLLIQTFFHLFLLAVMLRLLLQLARADFYNPISQFLVKATNPVLRPLRKIIPGVGGIDLASVVLIILLQMAAIALLVWVNGYAVPNVFALAVWGAVGMVGLVLNIYFVAILAAIILSWIAPGNYNPAVVLLHQLTEPVMAPFRRLLPPLGGLDLSPILVFLVINVLQIVVDHLARSVGTPVAYVIGV